MSSGTSRPSAPRRSDRHSRPLQAPEPAWVASARLVAIRRRSRGQRVATHFVQDLNQPLHAAWGETRAEHNEIETQMLYRSWQKDHTYRGFMLVKNYSCFAYEIAEKSSQHARALFFDREIRRVTGVARDQAVNDTANLWQSVFWHALGAERSRQLYGISAPVREPGHGSLC